jgi:hypothetical protein
MDARSSRGIELASPGRTFARGLLAGLVVVLVGDLATWLHDRGGGDWASVLMWILPAIAAAVAAACVAHAFGASLRRVLALGVVGLLAGFLISGVLQYVFLFSMVVPTDNLDPTGRWEGAASRLHLGLSALCILSGALLGMMFGRGRQPSG